MVDWAQSTHYFKPWQTRSRSAGIGIISSIMPKARSSPSFHIYISAISSWRGRIPSLRQFGPVNCKLCQHMWQIWRKIDRENCDGDCMQHMIISHAPVSRHVQCLMATIVSWHTGLFIIIILIFSQLVIFSSEDDKIGWVDHYWLCP